MHRKKQIQSVDFETDLKKNIFLQNGINTPLLAAIKPQKKKTITRVYNGLFLIVIVHIFNL